ncbi:MAG: preprotein translocase subunit YajC [Bacteroidetes bacterium]|nr:preprotein translocase subunit YajC [Bacteroidota bacterium]
MYWPIALLLQESSSSPGFGGLGMFLPLLLIFAVFYLFIIRPQQKREKKRKAMIQAVKRGDKVVTAGGIHGKVHQVDESSVLLDVDGGIKLRIEKNSVASVKT